MKRISAMIVSLVMLSAVHAGTPDQIQSCKALAPAGTAGTLAGCPQANVFFGPATTTDLVRTIVAGKQLWAPFNSLLPSSSVVPRSGQWVPLSSLTITPAPTVVTPPIPPPPVIVPITVVLSVDNQPTYEHVQYSNLPPGTCFTLTADPAHVAHACIPQ